MRSVYDVCESVRKSMRDRIVEKFDIDYTEVANVGDTVHSIGFLSKNKKWYGWSHRAICGFGIGDKIFDADFGDSETPFIKHGRVTIKNMDDAKKAAIAFADDVS